MSSLLKYSISNYKLSGWVEVDHRGLVVHSAPIFKVFIGQYATRLELWMKKMGETKVVLIPNNQMEFQFA